MKLRSLISARRLFVIISSLVLILAISLAWIGLPLLRDRNPSPSTAPSTLVSDASSNATRTETPVAANPSPLLATASPSNTVVPIDLNPAGSLEDHLQQQGVILLSMRDGLAIHLFAYHPLYLPLTRLPDLPFDTTNPSVSPDGTHLAYSSRQNGYWDLFILDLATGIQTRVTDTPEYESSPTWSPDGQWLAYERFDGLNQDIFILPLNDANAEPIRLTDWPGVESSPAWSPQGRQIAFVSDQSGDAEIWLADLDKIEGRFTNISTNPLSRDRFPAWSKEGNSLAWASEQAGDRRLVVWMPASGEPATRLNAEGDRPVWSPDGNFLFTEVQGPNQQDIAGYQFPAGRIISPMTEMPGRQYGMTWVQGPLPGWLLQAVQSGDSSPAPVLSQPILTQFPIAPLGRMGIVPLEDLTAPEPRMHDEVDEAFNDLRKQVGSETGWDALSSLENAFVAVTTPSDPSLQDNWLYTGRAFALNPLLVSAGWMTITREDFSGQTYWRVFLKARYQDGSMGFPLTEMIWDLNARYTGDPRSFEQGGRLNSAPPGYWIDLTELANRYGWERQPSLSDWRTYYPALQFNQFVITGGLDWHAAMAEIYPPEALITTTPPPTPSPTASEVPETPFPTVTVTPSVTPVPARRPTWTPLPTQIP